MERYLTKPLLLVAMSLLLSSCRFYEVDPGNLYRSSQPSETDLETYINEAGIKTIINLRGENPGKYWYDAEVAVAQRLQVNLISIPMSAGRLPHRADLIKLLDAFATAERPILIHCKAGADRTGEASAIYEMIYMGKTKEQALKMLTPQFAHFEKLMPAKRYFIGDLWVNERWAREEYDPCTQNYKFYDRNNGHCQKERQQPQSDPDGDT